MRSVYGLLTGVVTLGALTGCVRDRVTGKESFSLERWSTSEEREKGAEAVPNIESQFEGIYPDRGANEQLGKIVMNLVSHSPRARDFDWQFKILNSSEVNAFALPGGFVYITRGLLQKLKSEGEFVFALGHEIGHVEHQHAMLNQSRRDVAEIVNAPFTAVGAIGDALPVGGGAVNLAAGVAIAPSALLLLGYSRAQESEADERGVYFDVQLGLDPRTSTQMFEMFEDLQRKAGVQQYSWLSDHPLNKDRIEHVEQIIQKDYSNAPQGAKSSPEFDAVIKKFQADAPAYKLCDEASAFIAKEKPTPAELDIAMKKLAQAQGLLPDEPLIEVALGEAYYVKGDTDAARSHFQKALSLYDSRVPGESFWKPHFYLGVLETKEGRDQDAIEQLLTARKLFPLNPAVSYFLGVAYEQAGQTRPAREAYRDAAAAAPRGSQLGDEARRRAGRL